uniref:Uncharacterized protein n=1 Tax=Knipowitschia caucasica TaxID=637954 RepID=A0AAV2LRW5_KNICA
MLVGVCGRHITLTVQKGRHWQCSVLCAAASRSITQPHAAEDRYCDRSALGLHAADSAKSRGPKDTMKKLKGNTLEETVNMLQDQ